MSKEDEVTEARNRRQRKADAKHKLKSDAYRAKKLDEMSKKVNLGVLQVVGSMKKQPWCSRVSICWEILWKQTNPNYDEGGEWIGSEEDRFKLPWCVRFANFFKSSKESEDGK